MKIMIGNQNVLYPTPVTIVGALVNGKANFLNVAHVGILNAGAPHLISLSMYKGHYTNIGIREQKTFSVNILSQDQMVEMDYVGMVSGGNTDKSDVFETFYGAIKTAPIIRNCPLSMECRLVDIYELKTHEVFIGEVVATYADEAVLTDGNVDMAKVKPLLFDMNSMQYWSLGQAVGKCWNVGKQYRGKDKK
ncbi:MAG: flavin reductase family protein [Desulfuromonadaceae bacterium]|nr:flavin reductase family protein [Desulfuromonadaceae bacterium]MDD5106833.1 flavin reductase family protein [Desulfuromonadaceae bacterium]